MSDKNTDTLSVFENKVELREKLYLILKSKAETLEALFANLLSNLSSNKSDIYNKAVECLAELHRMSKENNFDPIAIQRISRDYLELTYCSSYKKDFDPNVRHSLKKLNRNIIRRLIVSLLSLGLSAVLVFFPDVSDELLRIGEKILWEYGIENPLDKTPAGISRFRIYQLSRNIPGIPSNTEVIADTALLKFANEGDEISVLIVDDSDIKSAKIKLKKTLSREEIRESEILSNIQTANLSECILWKNLTISLANGENVTLPLGTRGLAAQVIDPEQSSVQNVFITMVNSEMIKIEGFDFNHLSTAKWDSYREDTTKPRYILGYDSKSNGNIPLYENDNCKNISSVIYPGDEFCVVEMGATSYLAIVNGSDGEVKYIGFIKDWNKLKDSSNLISITVENEILEKLNYIVYLNNKNNLTEEDQERLDEKLDELIYIIYNSNGETMPDAERIERIKLLIINSLSNKEKLDEILKNPNVVLFSMCQNFDTAELEDKDSSDLIDEPYNSSQTPNLDSGEKFSTDSNSKEKSDKPEKVR